MNDDNIGWYWKIVGLLLLVGAIGISVFKVLHDKAFSLSDVALVLGFLVAAMIVVRPSWMDKHFKNLLDALPFVKYTKSGSDNNG